MKNTSIKTLLRSVPLCLLLWGCTEKISFQSSRWTDGEGAPPVIPTEKKNLIGVAGIRSQNEIVDIYSEKISGFIVEDSFVKSVRKESSETVFQSYAVLGEISDRQIENAKKLDTEKSLSWKLFNEKNPYFKGWQIVEPAVVVFAKKYLRFQPTLKAILASSDGTFFSVYFTNEGKLFKVSQIGSQLAGTSEVLALAFPKGPKKSELSQVILTRKSQSKGLENESVVLQSQSPVKIQDDRDLEVHPPDDRFDQVQAYYFSNQLLDWLGKKGVFQGPLRLSILTHVGFPDKTNTAFYYNGQVRLGSGDDEVFSRIAWDPSIVAHETSHAVIDLLSRLPFQGEGGSLNEGFADTFTTLHLDSPLLGEVSYKKAPFKRSVEPLLKLSEKNGGLYHDSLIVSGFFWSVRKTFGTDTALHLSLRVLNRLGPLSDFKDFTQTLNQQIKNNFSGEDLKKLQGVLKERELL